MTQGDTMWVGFPRRARIVRRIPRILRPQDDANAEIGPFQIVADCGLKAVPESIAHDPRTRIAVGWQISNVATKPEVVRHVVFHSAADPEAQRRPIRAAPAVRVVRESDAAGDVRPQFVLAAAEMEQA